MADLSALTLAELRALLRRVEEHRLEPGDWALVDAVVLGAIDEVERGKDPLSSELDDEDGDGGKAGGGEA